MSREEMVSVVQRYFDAWTTGDVSALDDVVSPDYRVHYPQEVRAPAGKAVEVLKECVAVDRAVYPDQTWAIDQWVVEGDRVAIACTMTGTHLGTEPTLQIPATGKKVKIAWVVIYRIANGKIAEVWEVGDYLGLLKQLKG